MLSALDGPFINSVNATPSDSTVLAQVSNALYVGGAGNVAIRWGIPQSGAQANGFFANVPAGTVLHVRADKIFSTGTTATNIVVLY